MRILMVVVFPAPFGPISAKTAPCGTVRSTPFSTGVQRNFLVSPVMRIGSVISCELLRPAVAVSSGRSVRPRHRSP